MKQVIMKWMFCFVLVGLTSCNGDEIFQKEQYKNVVYVLSGNDLTYSTSHSLNIPKSTGYVTVYVGGTLAIDQDITVKLEQDPDLLGKYNYSNFDLDESKYAKELSPSRYRIENYTVVLKANSEDPYVKLPIEITPDGLSPDSTYLIPLRIVDTGSFELNKSKSQVLYRVYIENDFATQKKLVPLFMRGTRLQDGEAGKPKQMSANKILYPLSKRGLRMNAGMENSANRNDLDLINKSSLIMEVAEEESVDDKGNKYNALSVKPYKSELIEVIQMGKVDDDGVEVSVKEANRYITEFDITRYYLSYKYRTLKTPATESTAAEWHPWVHIVENLKVPTE